jgi:hypothetical protein
MIVSPPYISTPEYQLQGVYDHKVDKYKPTFTVTPQIYESEPLRVEAGECIQASARCYIHRGRFGAV